MDLKKEDLIKEIEAEQEELEAKALKMYCKDELSRQKDLVKNAEKALDSLQKRMDSLTIEKLREDFNKNINFSGGYNSVKEDYIDRVTGKKS